ncbi:MAG: hypothetical protein U0996_01710 [Planctomycetaceae bacterium]
MAVAPVTSGVVFIGRTHPEFLPLLEWCAEQRLLFEHNIFSSIEAAFASSAFQTHRPALTIVLQNYPDEYPRDEVNRLIGHLLFGRVLCCQTSWCVSTGRTHDVWPIVSRVPAGSAIPVVGQALKEIALQIAPMLPMAAPEDVFAHRQAVAVPEHLSCRATCICSDRPLKSVAAAMLIHAGFPVSAESDSIEQLARFGFVLCDEMDVRHDPNLIAQLSSVRDQSFVVCMTEFPGQQKPDWAHAIVEKTELQVQLSSAIRQFRIWMSGRQIHDGA